MEGREIRAQGPASQGPCQGARPTGGSRRPHRDVRHSRELGLSLEKGKSPESVQPDTGSGVGVELWQEVLCLSEDPVEAPRAAGRRCEGSLTFPLPRTE